jgi:hypothetical protein
MLEPAAGGDVVFDDEHFHGYSRDSFTRVLGKN